MGEAEHIQRLEKENKVLKNKDKIWDMAYTKLEEEAIEARGNYGKAFDLVNKLEKKKSDLQGAMKAKGKIVARLVEQRNDLLKENKDLKEELALTSEALSWRNLQEKRKPTIIQQV